MTFEKLPDQTLNSCQYDYYVRRQTYQSTPSKVCYQVQTETGVEVCYEGDDYTITENLIDENQYDIFYRYQRYIDFGGTPAYTWSNWISWGYRSNLLGKDLPCYSQLLGSNNHLRIYYFDADTGQSFNSATYVYYVATVEFDYRGEKENKIEIFKNGQLVHQHISSNPISAYIEPETQECTWSDWKLKGNFTIASNNNQGYSIAPSHLGEKCNQLVVNQTPFKGIPNIFLGGGECSDNDCAYPEWRVVPNDSCIENPPPPDCKWIECPEGYYFDQEKCLCLLIPCPDGTYRNDTGDCIPICIVKECPENYYFDYDLCDCVKQEIKIPDCAPFTCPENYYFDYQICDCVRIPEPEKKLCEDKNALNYKGELPCVYPQRCEDPKALNYDEIGDCEYKKGCSNPNADNYDSTVVIDDGSCYILGCTNPYALNFDLDATKDDGSCILPIVGCTDKTALNYNPDANIHVQDFCIYPQIRGCDDPDALNYDPNVTSPDIRLCRYKSGCTDWRALNYDKEAVNDDDSCIFPEKDPCEDNPTCDNFDCPNGYFKIPFPPFCIKYPIRFREYPPPPENNPCPDGTIPYPDGTCRKPPPPKKDETDGGSNCLDCPPQTAIRFVCDGWVCCYDSNCCLVSYFKVEDEC